MKTIFAYVVAAIFWGFMFTSCSEREEKIDMFTITFNSSEGSSVVSQTIVKGEKATKPDDPVREGHTFMGWYKEAELTNEWMFPTDLVTTDIVLYAKWIVSYLIIFNCNGGPLVAMQTLFLGDKITKPDDPVRNGYLFGGWYKDAKFTNEWMFLTDVVTTTTVLYAKWTAYYIITFDSNGGSEVAPQTVIEREMITKPEDPVRPGYEFVAWFIDPGLINKYNWGEFGVHYSMTLYAKWLAFDPDFKISGLTIDNYPSVDGSTSTEPLNVLIACKLLDIVYNWRPRLDAWSVITNFNENIEKLQERIKSSQTHQSFMNLIDKQADMILSARTLSPDEKEYADGLNVSLVETPIALDAFIFIVHPSNPIQSLTIQQIQDIYTGKITNWKEVGGRNATIKPFVRNANSGSQELMESMVMKDLVFKEFPESPNVVFTMQGVFDAVSQDANAICYSVYYYNEHILGGTYTKTLAIDEVSPNKESISKKTYPLVAEVYSTIRSDLDKSSMAYKLYELLQTEHGKRVIAESGYVPYYQ